MLCAVVGFFVVCAVVSFLVMLCVVVGFIVVLCEVVGFIVVLCEVVVFVVVLCGVVGFILDVLCAVVGCIVVRCAAVVVTIVLGVVMGFNDELCSGFNSGFGVPVPLNVIISISVVGKYSSFSVVSVAVFLVVSDIVFVVGGVSSIVGVDTVVDVFVESVEEETSGSVGNRSFVNDSPQYRLINSSD